MFKWMKRLVALVGGDEWSPSPVRSRVDLPLWRDVSDVLPRLRLIHRDLDVYVENTGTVLLLQHQPGKPRIVTGRRLLEKGVFTVDAKLMSQGFALLDDLDPWAIQSGKLLMRARQIMYATPEMVRQAWKEKLSRSDGSYSAARSEERMRDRVRSDYRSDHRILFRHRVSIVRPDINYGPSPVGTT